MSSRRRLHDEFEPESPESAEPATPMGELVAAVMGDYGTVTVVDVAGVEADLPAEASETAELGEPQQPDKILNRGADRVESSIGGRQFEAKSEGDAEYEYVDESRNREPEDPERRHDYWTRLQRNSDTRDRSRVNYEGDSVPSGGGGGGTGKAKDPKPGRGSGGAPLPANAGIVNTGALRFRIAGVPAGPRHFYDQRPGELHTVLIDLCRRIVEQKLPLDYEGVLPPTRGLGNLDDYGLTDEHIELLKLRRGLARRTVMEHAYAHGGRERLEAIDAGAQQPPRSRTR
jgi:hypothetical protein